MRLLLQPGILLAEPVVESEPLVILPEGVLPTQVAVVLQSAYEDVSVGDRILHAARAGLKIRSNGQKYILLDAGDVLAKLIEYTTNTEGGKDG